MVSRLLPEGGLPNCSQPKRLIKSKMPGKDTNDISQIRDRVFISGLILPLFFVENIAINGI